MYILQTVLQLSLVSIHHLINSFSRSVVSDSLWPHGLQHAKSPCPSPSTRDCSNSCPSSRWCHPAISSSVIPFSCLQSFPASGSFPMSQFFASGGQSIGALASASITLVTENHHSYRKKFFSLWGELLGLARFSSVQSLSRVRLFVTPWIAACQASMSITNSRSSLRLTSIELVMPSSHLILWHPLLLLPPIPPCIRVFTNESTLHTRWPKY